MPEANKDPAIKLFGRTISLPRHNIEVCANDSSQDHCYDDHSPLSPSSSSDPREVSFATQHEAENDKEPSRKELTSVPYDEASHQTTEDPKSPNNNGTQSETSVSQQDKTSPKKPGKILPCPRCSSMDTKFCYFNNYNANQPRHFCKNCQRYWTAGGTMRNVPVGAGRRKNKNSSTSSSNSSFSCASHYRQVMVPDQALQRGNNAVLTFGSDPPLCDSIASVLSLADKTVQNGVANGFHSPMNKFGDSVVAPTSSDKNRGHSGSHEFVQRSYQCNLVPPWPYPWNTAMPPPPALCQPGCPVSFYATPTYWGCVPPPPSWGAHPIDHCAPSGGPNSPTLGKHTREGNMLDKAGTESNNNKSENGVLIPKTLRIDDPGEAARSSVWSTLAIKSDKTNSLSGGGLFKAFPTKGDDKKLHLVEASPVLQANPAALSRSLIFHERT